MYIICSYVRGDIWKDAEADTIEEAERIIAELTARLSPYDRRHTEYLIYTKEEYFKYFAE